MAQLNAYKMRPAQSWGPGVTQRKHIAEIFGKNPQKMNDIMVRAYTANYGYQFSNLIKNHTSVREFDSDEEYTWQLIGSTYKNVPLLECRDEFGVVVTADHGVVGKGGAPFQLVFGEAYFGCREMIVGELNEYYQFLILDEMPTMEGPNAVYNVQLMAGGQEGCPAERLLPGEKFSQEFNPVESELSRKAGGIRKGIPTLMRNEFTTIRKSHKFTGNANLQQKLDCDIPIITKDKDGKEKKMIVNSWFDHETWIFASEWEQEKERTRLYSRSNRNTNGSYLNHGKSGLAIREGDGIMAQMLYGNTTEYNAFGDDFSIDGLAEGIYDICESGNVPINQRKFVVLTGSRGMMQASKAIEKLTGGFKNMTGLTYNGDALGIVEQTKSDAHQTALAYGAQFTEYRAPNGVVLTFVLEPSFDDPYRNKIPGPNNKGLLSSYAYYIFDLGTKAEPNMYICKVKGQEDYYRYRIGMRNPFGITNNNVINYDEDSAEVHTMAILGAAVLDPTRCLSYLPSGLIA